MLKSGVPGFTMDDMRAFLAEKGVARQYRPERPASAEAERRYDLDVIELNETFAAQALAVTRALGLPDDAERVNPNGGAIALGHPLGASGTRLALTAALELHDRGARRVLATMCIGVGQGIAVLFEAA